nr:hypothetical protein CFP56_69475 [Quercus suber]
MNYQPVDVPFQYYPNYHPIPPVNHLQPQLNAAPFHHQCRSYRYAAPGNPSFLSPLQQSDANHMHCTEHQSVASGFKYPGFRPHRTLPHCRYQQYQPYCQYQPFKMTAFGDMTDQQIADLQHRSNAFEPEVTGPLVGQRESSTAIAAEYALTDTDPVLQAKARVSDKIPRDQNPVLDTYAIAFGYFEALLRFGEVNKFANEEARLRSLVNVVSTAGVDLGLYADFADEVYELLRKARQALRTSNAEIILLETFNDETTQNYIITCFKVYYIAGHSGFTVILILS